MPSGTVEPHVQHSKRLKPFMPSALSAALAIWSPNEIEPMSDEIDIVMLVLLVEVVPPVPPTLAPTDMPIPLSRVSE